jgi:hypothetical protein
MPATASRGAQYSGWLRGMIQQFQNPKTVASAQVYRFVPSDDFFGGRQCRTQHKRCKIQTLIRGSGGEDSLLLARTPQFETNIARH